MKNFSKYMTALAVAFWVLLGCTQDQKTVSDLQIVRNNNNRKSYPVAKMDSAQAIATITRQKIQELFDLSTLYTSGNRDTEIDSVIYAQMQSYFAGRDSADLSPLLRELDSLKVQTAKVGEITVSKEVVGTDTLDLARFYVEYFDVRNRHLGTFEKNAQYILKPAPVKFKKEFRFYFIGFDVELIKDSTSAGVTR